jgi:hypothetical protein
MFLWALFFLPCTAYPLDCTLRDLELRDTLDIYFSGRIVGRLVHWAVHDGPSARLHVHNEMRMNTGGPDPGSMTGGITLLETRAYDARGEMLSARQDLHGQSGVNTWKLSKIGNQWAYTTTVGNASTTRNVSDIHDNLLSMCKLWKGVREKTLKKGDTWRDTAFELMSAQPLIAKITCTNVDTMRHWWTFETVDNISGRAEKQVIDKNGNTLEQSIEGIYIARAKNTGQRRGNGDPSDTTGDAGELHSSKTTGGIAELFSIPADHRAGAGESIVVTAVDSAIMLDESVSGFYGAEGKKWTLRPLPQRCLAGGIGSPGRDLEQWLQPTAALQSGHHEIIALSKRIRGKEKDPCALIAVFNHYVYSFLKKRETATFSNALETLHAGYGDCGEHSALLAALLRASGVPARVVLGLLYVEAKKAYFYHAQVIAFAGAWVFADPTWDIFPAYGAFVPLIVDDTGSKALLLSRLIGKIRIEYGKDDGTPKP